MAPRTFGLVNTRGSCWVNSCLQAVFRIPDVQQRLEEETTDPQNPVEMALAEIWGSRGDEGLKDFYKLIKSDNMPAGEGIGDAHELLSHLCDKMPYLDKLMRFHTANTVRCRACKHTEVRKESYIDFTLAPSNAGQSVSQSVLDAVTPQIMEDWKCDKCGKTAGCQTQMALDGALPTLLTFRKTTDHAVSYPSVLTMNKKRYNIFAVVCYDGGHWWTFGRDLPPGSTEWFEFNDKRVASFDPRHYPHSDNARLLMYYRAE